MIIELLPKTEKQYRANLHSHSTVSDGQFTPEELKKRYMDRGYSIIAYTDHNALVTHNELSDENFLALNGYEIDTFRLVDPSEGFEVQCLSTHLCLIAKDKNTDTMPLYVEARVPEGAKDKVKYNRDDPHSEREYDADCINSLIKAAHDSGFFVTYNHPAWSFENFRQYSLYKGLDACEIMNFASVIEGYPDEVPYVYDDLLREGNDLSCVATDDNHNEAGMFGGSVVFCAEELTYEAIISALEKGHFYAVSRDPRYEGPEFDSITFDGYKFTVKTKTPVRSVSFSSNHRLNGKTVAKDDNGIMEAEFTVVDTWDKRLYVRIVLEDYNGNRAYSNAYRYNRIAEEMGLR